MSAGAKEFLAEPTWQAGHCEMYWLNGSYIVHAVVLLGVAVLPASQQSAAASASLAQLETDMQVVGQSRCRIVGSPLHFENLAVRVTIGNSGDSDMRVAPLSFLSARIWQKGSERTDEPDFVVSPDAFLLDDVWLEGQERLAIPSGESRSVDLDLGLLVKPSAEAIDGPLVVGEYVALVIGQMWVEIEGGAEGWQQIESVPLDIRVPPLPQSRDLPECL